MADVPEVLFMCTHNAGRSQMAAALLAREGGDAVRVTSAGSEPASQVNPAVAAAMAEIGVDISREIPKPLAAGQAEAADIVISMGCGDACPVFPRQALPGVGAARPGRAQRRAGPPYPRSISPPGSAPCSKSWRSADPGGIAAALDERRVAPPAVVAADPLAGADHAEPARSCSRKLAVFSGNTPL